MMRAGDSLKCGLIGKNLGQSRFADGLDMMCRAHGLSLEFQLIDDAVSRVNLAETLERCHGSGWAGASVTHPFKQEAATWLGPGLSAPLRRLGACNLVTFSGSSPGGANTDYSGFLSAWRDTMADAAPGRVAMAGAGGVACAIGHALSRLGAAEIVIWDRDPALAQALAGSIGATARAVQIEAAQDAVAAADGLVNATPLGMHAYPGTAISVPLQSRPNWAFDAVYTPVETQFVQAARRAGAAVITGFDLFRHMVLQSFETYTGLVPDTRAGLARLNDLKPEKG